MQEKKGSIRRLKMGQELNGNRIAIWVDLRLGLGLLGLGMYLDGKEYECCYRSFKRTFKYH